MVTYDQVKAELIFATRTQETVPYQRIARLMHLPPSGNYMGHEIGYILGEISEDAFEVGHPMLSAIAVSNSGKPGDGFYALARELNLLQNQTEEEFWEDEKCRVYDAWALPEQVELY